MNKVGLSKFGSLSTCFVFAVQLSLAHSENPSLPMPISRSSLSKSRLTSRQGMILAALKLVGNELPNKPIIVSAKAITPRETRVAFVYLLSDKLLMTDRMNHKNIVHVTFSRNGTIIAPTSFLLSQKSGMHKDCLRSQAAMLGCLYMFTHRQYGDTFKLEIKKESNTYSIKISKVPYTFDSSVTVEVEYNKGEFVVIPPVFG